MWTGARNSPARNARERETRSKTGRWIFGRAFRVPAAEKGNWTGKTAPLSGAAKGTGYSAPAGEEGGWPRTVTEGNRDAGDGQDAVGGRRRAQAGLEARAGSVAPRLSSETLDVRQRKSDPDTLVTYPALPYKCANHVRVIVPRTVLYIGQD